MEVKQSVKFTLFSEVSSTLVKKYITDMIDVNIFEQKGCFVIAFGARAPPSFNTTACDVTGMVRSVGQLTIEEDELERTVKRGDRHYGWKKSWTCCFGVKSGSETNRVYVDTRHNSHSDYILCIYSSRQERELNLVLASCPSWQSVQVPHWNLSRWLTFEWLKTLSI